MLFDLRGRGRRRTVRIIYGGLALLIGAGLVFFGVGAGIGGGGLLNSLTSSEGSSSASFANQIKKYKKLTQQQPSNAHAWEQLTLAQLHEAAGEAYYANQRLTSKGKELYGQTAQSWSRYIALKPAKPNVEIAQEMVRVFGEEGLNEPAEAVRVLQVVTAARPESAALYAALAEYAYKAGNTRIGDLASAKAVTLAPSAQRQQLKTQLATIKAHPQGTSGEGASSGQGTEGASSGAATATTPTTTTSTTPGNSSTSAKK